METPSKLGQRGIVRGAPPGGNPASGARRIVVDRAMLTERGA